MSNPNWTLSANTDPLDILKSEMYCDISGTTYNTLLTTLGEMITDQMITYLNNPSWVDVSNPPLSLRRAALKQTAHEFKQKKTPGLQSVTFTDGSINKMQIDEWLKDVKNILDRYYNYVLYETAS